MYKYMSFELKDMQVDAQKSFYRELSLPKEVEAFRPPIDYAELIGDTTLLKLHEIFKNVIRRQEDKVDPVRSNFGRIEKDEVSVEEKTSYVQAFITTHKRFLFRELLEKQGSKMDVIVTFLVVLEMMKTGKLTVEQETIDDEIVVIAKQTGDDGWTG